MQPSHPDSLQARPGEPHVTTVVERNAVRLVLLDARPAALLLHTRDFSDETFDSAWELPGGGIEPGESFLEAAVREIREETGLELEPRSVEDPRWNRDVLYTYRGERRLQHERIAIARLPAIAPHVSTSIRVNPEDEDHFEARANRRLLVWSLLSLELWLGANTGGSAGG